MTHTTLETQQLANALEWAARDLEDCIIMLEPQFDDDTLKGHKKSVNYTRWLVGQLRGTLSTPRNIYDAWTEPSQKDRSAHE